MIERCFFCVVVTLVGAITAVDAFVNVDPSICLQGIKIGPCRARVQAYGYDARLGQCRYFAFGGCKGNMNRFPTLERCKKVCENNKDAFIIPEPEVKQSAPTCVGPSFYEAPDEHDCKPNRPVYKFNEKTGSCEKSLIGCGKVHNMFTSLEKCVETCKEFIAAAAGAAVNVQPARSFPHKIGNIKRFVFGKKVTATISR